MNNENEIWVDVLGYTGVYKVSNLGRLYSISKNKVRTLKPTNDYSMLVRMYSKGNSEVLHLEDIVYNSFHPDNVYKVQFRNLDSTDCRLDNLYVIPKSNTNELIIEQEVWKPIPLDMFSDNYLISNRGRIKNKSGHILVPYKEKSGVLSVGLSKNNKSKTVRIAPLVYKAFYGVSRELIDYKDGNPDNVSLENLY